MEPQDDVYTEMRNALALDTVAGYVRAREIARAHPDVFLSDGSPRMRELNSECYDDGRHYPGGDA